MSSCVPMVAFCDASYGKLFAVTFVVLFISSRVYLPVHLPTHHQATPLRTVTCQLC